MRVEEERLYVLCKGKPGIDLLQVRGRPANGTVERELFFERKWRKEAQ